MTKADLRQAILSRLEADLRLQSSAAVLARDEAISEESRAENKYDTHSQEAAYLAEAQAKLAAEIRENLEFYTAFPLPDLAPGSPIVPGAVVELGANGTSSWFILGPRAGGLEIEVDGRRLMIVTPHSPLGRSLLGRRAGDLLPASRGGGAQGIRSVS